MRTNSKIPPQLSAKRTVFFFEESWQDLQNEVGSSLLYLPYKIIGNNFFKQIHTLEKMESTCLEHVESLTTFKVSEALGTWDKLENIAHSKLTFVQFTEEVTDR